MIKEQKIITQFEIISRLNPELNQISPAFYKNFKLLFGNSSNKLTITFISMSKTAGLNIWAYETC